MIGKGMRSPVEVEAAAEGTRVSIITVVGMVMVELVAIIGTTKTSSLIGLTTVL